MMNRIKNFFAHLFIFVFNRFPIKTNKIFFISYYGSQYGCNPKYITEYLLQDNTSQPFDIVWAFNDPNSKDQLRGLRKVKTMSIRYFYELCTSKVIITNFRTTSLFKKRKNQYYVQTWHSSLRLKQIEKDAGDALPKSYIQMAKRDSEKCDLLLSGCEFSTRIFERAFWYNGHILKSGTPRNDVLFRQNEHIKRKLADKFKIPIDSKIILYAPTFRKDHNLEVYNLDYPAILNQLEQRFGGDWIFLVKLHPHLLSKSDQLIYGDQVKDVTAYDDIQELLSVTDVLISDYSSLMFDFTLTKRPCLLYVPDLKEYVHRDRELYFDIEQLPFPHARDNQELLELIHHFQFTSYYQKLSRFNDEVGFYEKGNASEQLIEHLKNVCFGETKRRQIHEAV